MQPWRAWSPRCRIVSSSRGGPGLPGAQAALENARRLSPELASVHFHLGQLYRQLGNADASRAAFTEALRLEPGAPWAAEAKAALQTKPAAKR